MINISFNDSVFNSDEMRTRLSQLCIPTLTVETSFLPDKYWKNIDFSDPDRERSPEDKKKIKLVINAHNDTTSMINVTTNDVKYIEDNEEIPNKFDRKYPHLLIQLRPNESFRAMANAILCPGERNHIWSPMANCWFTEDGPNQYALTLKSLGQMNEYDILVKACQVIVKKIEDIKNQVETAHKSNLLVNTKKVAIELDNEDHAMGNLISRTLQDRKDVIFASYQKPDHLVKSIIIKITSVKNPMEPFFGALKTIQTLYREIEKSLKKVGKNKVSKYLN